MKWPYALLVTLVAVVIGPPVILLGRSIASGSLGDSDPGEA